MTSDILTMIWKELRDTLRMPTPGSVISGTRLDGLIKPLLPVVLLGIIVPLRAGPAWITSTLSLIAMGWLPLFLVLSVIADSFAGERERNTLETLLATRLSDKTILVGKIASTVVYAWGQVVVSLLAGLLTVNLAYGHGRLIMFAAKDIYALLVFSLLVSILIACGGVLVSLRAATVQQAWRNMVFGFTGVIFGAIFISAPKTLPAQWRAAIANAVFAGSLLRTEILLALFLLAVDLALYLAARGRFQRARLILD